MKVTHSSSDKLILSHRPWRLSVFLGLCAVLILALFIKSIPILSVAGWFGCVIGLLVAIAAAAYFAQWLEADFDHTEGKAVLKHGLGPWHTETTVSLPNVEYLLTQTGHDQGTQRLALKLVDRMVPLTRQYSAFEDWDPVKDAVNAWLRNHRSKYEPDRSSPGGE